MEKNIFICLPNVNGKFTSREECQTDTKSISSAERAKQEALAVERAKQEALAVEQEKAQYEEEIAKQEAIRAKQEKEQKDPAIATRIALIKSTNSIIDNKNALIWAFNEAIDKDTTFDGNTLDDSKTEMIDIIQHLLSIKCFDDNITEQIIQKYLEILKVIKTIIPISIL
jgi:hypothetical protein